MAMGNDRINANLSNICMIYTKMTDIIREHLFTQNYVDVYKIYITDTYR